MEIWVYENITLPLSTMWGMIIIKGNMTKLYKDNLTSYDLIHFKNSEVLIELLFVISNKNGGNKSWWKNIFLYKYGDKIIIKEINKYLKK